MTHRFMEEVEPDKPIRERLFSKTQHGHAEKCPVCGGSGKLPNSGYTTSAIEERCHGCSGRGWVTVYDK